MNSVLGSGYSQTSQPPSGASLTVLPFPAPYYTLAYSRLEFVSTSLSSQLVSFRS
jgi:hypothetical protein